MDIRIKPCTLAGTIHVIPSKSQAHRYLICAAFADKPTDILCPETSRDMEATADCLRALGSRITAGTDGYHVEPAVEIPPKAELFCRDSGSTLRFLLPVAGALGIDALFHLEGRLSRRPLSPMWEEMERMGCNLSRQDENSIRCTGRLAAGTYSIDGGISSQFITGLLLACSRIPGRSCIEITGKLESAPYVLLTTKAMAAFGCQCADLLIDGGRPFLSPGFIHVEGDWSNGAFFLAANVLGGLIQISGLSTQSAQGDIAAAKLLPALREKRLTIDASDIPDLVPILAVTASCFHGAVFTGIRRLRLKESDRAASVCTMIRNMGGNAQADENTLTVEGTGLTGGTVDAGNDHRIAMAAAIAAAACRDPVTILGAECVEKSYPRFWDEYRRLGGNYEQLLR